ncbi:hypothetical protein LV85_04200 [Algoriphagus chordae]|uniref:Alpha-L-rhamnosidase six-hairpin glycosidase domain-containing protein n=2 Tax=Algoriphagus chordae TaxID=237019 RepID=A0A2W7QHS4_9BACT|nr:hypothetical protein LV85_04200 [Algoriphagus chordae]
MIKLAFNTLLLLLFIPFCSFAQEISLKSDNKYLEENFTWAVQKANTWKMTGKSGEINRHEGGEGLGYKAEVKFIPSYWAGYAHRSAYYIRDFVHQIDGAHLVGMDEENFAMMEKFAEYTTEDKKWYSWWALNFDGSVFTLDAPNPPGIGTYQGYPSDFVNKPGESFVREIPAMFELVEKAWKSYLWTGDRRYIEDEKLWRMYEKVVTDFVSLHDSDGNGIPEGQGDIFQGSSTYNEADIHPLEAGDAIGSQYQAYLAYAAFLSERNLKQQAKEQEKNAAALKDYFNTNWSVVEVTNLYASATTSSHEKYPFFNKETSWFMPMKLLTEPGPRNEAYLDFISEELGDGVGTANAKKGSPANIEAYTYLPDTYFPYGRVDEAWKWMKYIIDEKEKPHYVTKQGNNGNYPEVSFTLVSQVVEGLMGIEPNAAELTISTIPRLPAEIQYLALSNLKIGEHTIEVYQSKNKTEITNSASSSPLTCNIRFYGEHKHMFANGKKTKAKTAMLNGKIYSFISVQLNPGEKVVATL